MIIFPGWEYFLCYFAVDILPDWQVASTVHLEQIKFNTEDTNSKQANKTTIYKGN